MTTIKAKTDESEFLQAACAFDEALTRFIGAMEAAQRGPLNSAKSLERAAQMLTNVAEAEDKLRSASQALSTALNHGQEQQVRLAQQVTVRADLIAARTVEFQALIERYGQLGAAAGSLNDDLAEILRKKKESKATTEGKPADSALDVEISTLQDRLTQLADSAQELHEAARKADFEDIIRQADSIRQQLLAARNKLALFSRNAN